MTVNQFIQIYGSNFVNFKLFTGKVINFLVNFNYIGMYQSNINQNFTLIDACILHLHYYLAPDKVVVLAKGDLLSGGVFDHSS